MTVLRRGLALLALLTSLWALVLWLFHGFTFSLGGVEISSANPMRPLIVAGVAAGAYVWLTGVGQARRELSRFADELTTARLAGLLALSVVAVGFGGTSWAASGADAYGYVSHADLWLHGQLKTPVPFAEVVPWPNGLETLTPFAYRRVPDENAIVPVTAPGLPMLMALLKALAGHCAVFWVGPFAGGLLVWVTFVLGRRVGSEAIGLGGAWLLATSPVFLLMFKAPMSDVPAAAFWTLAAAGVLAESRRAALGGGLSASMAILMRPNLAPLALAMGIWSAWRQMKRERRVTRGLVFAMAVLPGCLAVAWFNATLFGSPLMSGYGRVSSLFSLSNVAANVRLYGSWLIDTQTTLALAGMLALLVPARQSVLAGSTASEEIGTVVRSRSPVPMIFASFRGLVLAASPWRTVDSRDAARLLASVMLLVWAVDRLYTPYDAWWYLRFLLPAWPAMCIGTAAIVIRLLEDRGVWARRAAAGFLLGLGAYCGLMAVRLGVFPEDEGERRYVTVAEIVGRSTEPSSVIFTGQHVGSVLYYAGRVTVQFDALDPAWLDRAIEWLTQQGLHPYILLEDWERPLFERRFAAFSTLGRLELAPVVAYKGRTSGSIYLFDPLRPDGPTLWSPPVRHRRPRCVDPAVAPALLSHPR